LNDDLPQNIEELLDDPKENPGPLVTQVQCLQVHLKLTDALGKKDKALEHRLTRLESLNTINILISLGALVGLLAALWKLFRP
jgi:hypothetical protein